MKVADVAHWNPVLYRLDATPTPRRRPHRARSRSNSRSARSIRSWTTWLARSRDGGRTFEGAAPLVAGDRGGRGAVRNKPIRLASGDWLAGASTEAWRRWDAFFDRSPNGIDGWVATAKVEIDRARFEGKGLIQPTLWESEPGRVHALFRTTDGRVHRSDSDDDGHSWSTAYPIDVPNNNSALDLARLADGTLALACNPVPGNWAPRTPLSLLFSRDNGASWPWRFDVETGPGEFSYPAVIASGEGLALCYTWNRRRIAFVRIPKIRELLARLTPQQEPPIMTRRFGFDSTAEEVARDIDLTGKTAVVTGVSAGLGIETARVLASRGAKVVCVARDKEKTEKAVAGLRAANPKGDFEIALLDLSDLESVRRGADDIAKRFAKINFLINNAGVMACPLVPDEGGPRPPARHQSPRPLRADRPPAPADPRRRPGPHHQPLERGPPHVAAARRGPALREGSLRQVGRLRPGQDREHPLQRLPRRPLQESRHPRLRGPSRRDPHRARPPSQPGRLQGHDGRRPQAEPMKFKQVPQGAATSVWAATAPELEGKGGVYCEDCGIAEPIKSPDASIGVMPWALDREAAKQLIALSEKWSGQVLPA